MARSLIKSFGNRIEYNKKIGFSTCGKCSIPGVNGLKVLFGIF